MPVLPPSRDGLVERLPDDNRTELRRLAAAASVTGGPPPGLVAFRGADAVGWVSLGPREDYARLAHSKLLAPIDDRPVWSIVCFVVAAAVRRRGVARALLDAAIEYARARGVRTLEAYPLHEARGRVPSNSAYVGTQSMFERAGFTVAEERRWNQDTLPRPIVRLELDGPGVPTTAQPSTSRPRTAPRRRPRPGRAGARRS